MYITQVIDALIVLIDGKLFFRVRISDEKISLIWRHQHCQWRTAKFRPINAYHLKLFRMKGFWISCYTFCDTLLHKSSDFVVSCASYSCTPLVCLWALWYFDFSIRNYPVTSPFPFPYLSLTTVTVWFLANQTVKNNHQFFPPHLTGSVNFKQF